MESKQSQKDRETHTFKAGKAGKAVAVSYSGEQKKDLFRARTNKLCQITTMEKQIEQLMEDDANVDAVKTKSRIDFVALKQDFRDLNNGLQQFMTKEEFRNNQIRWFYPKNKVMNNFFWKCEEWMKEVRKRSEKADNCDREDIKSASSRSSGKCPSATGSQGGSAPWKSSTSSIRLKAELERASLQAKSAALNEKLAIEREEAEFEAERKRIEATIKARKEKHAMETAIAEWKAKIEVLQKYDHAQEFEEHEKKNCREEQTPYRSSVHASRCTICLSHERSCVFLECGHVCTCTLCYEALSDPKKCPICRATIDRMVLIYNI
ncbi:putative E3 ubiquitin-protein ligase RF298 [Hippocampus comes]|uniref:putative E3 ubiquitin-protein ligase RF298 n=1 Tax=Hippocampus comes TaxID=109280 RepID=UPI00094EBE6B|nr:PREDICTED: putative E3 ubiquitin-protein ligase RF298 [Hippocampus comes]XP_019740014.1 PREDICTED: putative E3 ubiquitin-protein ligase RF298 [Hippocampus comes]